MTIGQLARRTGVPIKALRRRILDFQAAYTSPQAQLSELIRLFASDPRRAPAKSAS